MTTKSILEIQQSLLDDVEGFDYFRAGCLLADCLESFHGVVRDVNPHPDIKQYMDIVKGTSMGQIIRDKAKEGSAYEIDDAREYLTYLENVKKINAEKNDALKEDDLIFYDGDFDPEFDSEKLATTHHAGYLLYKTIKKKPNKCDKCIVFYIAADGDEFKQQPVNFLIKCREYKENGLITPSEIANEIFQAAEVWFRSNRFHYMKKEGQIKILTQLISDKIKTEFNPPHCCRDKIIRRFVMNRMHFWAAFINNNMKEVNDQNISEAANSSKTAKRASDVPS